MEINFSIYESNEIIIELIDKSAVLFKKSCNYNEFCECLPVIFSEIMNNFLKKTLDDVKFTISFDKKKHITTYRILKSFISGYTIKKVN